ncbi:MAG: TonB-dependent receptor plug domain-containing protein [Bacteroidota bacterium]
MLRKSKIRSGNLDMGKRKATLLWLGLLPCLWCFGQQPEGNTLTVCWDMSLSMQERDLDKDLAVLDSIMAKDAIHTVQLLTFSCVVQEQIITIPGGDASTLKRELSEISYDGASFFEQLNNITKKGKVLVFTDGRKTDPNDFLSLDKGDVIINSADQADRKTLQLWGFLNRVTVVDLATGQKSPKSKVSSSERKGAVYLDGLPIANVLIHTSGGKSMITDNTGGFTYNGGIGDTLWIKVDERIKHQLVVNDREAELNFYLDSKTIALDEVVVKENVLKIPQKVSTAYGMEDARAVGYSVGRVGDKDISDSEAKLHEALDGKVSGVQISKASGWDNKSTLGKTLIRGSNSLNMNNYALIVIDGIPMESSKRADALGATQFASWRSTSSNDQFETNTDYIDPSNIAEVTVLKGLAATNRFGTLGANGVIMITTKTGRTENGSDKAVDRARLTNNIFEGNLATRKGKLVTPYLKELQKARDLKTAYQKYLVQRESFQDQFVYFIDVSDYFRTANAALADQVLSNVLEIPREYEALRSLFLKYSELQNAEMALLTAKIIKAHFPEKIQSYYDLAVAEQRAGNFQIAADLFNGIVIGSLDPTLDFSPMNKTASTALRNLVNQHRSALDISKISTDYQNNLTYNVRLVFDWEGPDKQFILKFVNPQKRFFDWEHSRVADGKRISSEIMHGHATEQFEIVGDIAKGEWQVYVTNLSKERATTPFWIKCTLQYNFGKANQRTEERLIRLSSSEDKEQLFFKFTSS